LFVKNVLFQQPPYLTQLNQLLHNGLVILDPSGLALLGQDALADHNKRQKYEL
jgi:hypothetical protein